jgi:hypothetical protein
LLLPAFHHLNDILISKRCLRGGFHVEGRRLGDGLASLMGVGHGYLCQSQGWGNETDSEKQSESSVHFEISSVLRRGYRTKGVAVKGTEDETRMIC